MGGGRGRPLSACVGTKAAAEAKAAALLMRHSGRLRVDLGDGVPRTIDVTLID